ncbi:MAG: Gfo/Idh/MocA family oxidoreductase [Clostridia bacterium]
MRTPNIMLIGCGPHAKRVYVPKLKEIESNFGIKLKAVVELKEKQEDILPFVSKYFENVNYIFVDKFEEKFKQSLPDELENRLNSIIAEENINSVIIATDPLNHMQYALWALKHNLHILMDKPISTYDNISNNVEQAEQLKRDYELLVENYSADKAFIVNAQRRFLPQFQIVQDFVNEIANKYGMPITSMQSTHSDGQWRLPEEVLKFKYHPLLGWGKVSHSGYHFIDMASKMVKDSFKEASKSFDEISVYSKFIRPSGVLLQQNQRDLEKIFGDKYKQFDSRTDEELLKIYKGKNEAEVDANSIISLSYNGIPVTNITLNLMHNGFSRRSWLNSNMKDLYKGNGRVRHEYHNIEQGCLQNIQIHSYQSKDKHDTNNERDFEIGGNNHYDIYVFKNSEIVGGQTLQIIKGKDIAERYFLDKTRIMNELARHEALKQFLEVIVGKRKAKETKSNILDHKMSVELMSLIYKSGTSEKEIKEEYKD